MKKKHLLKLLSGSLVLMLILSFSTADASSSSTREGWPKYISLTSPSVGSVLYIVEQGLALMMKKHLGIDAGAVAVGGSEAGVRALGKGDAEMGLVAVLECYQAVRGEGKFKGNKIQIRQLFCSWPICFVILATKASGITTIEDFKGKKVLWNSPTSGITRETARTLLKCYGFEDPEKDMVAMPLGSQKDAAHGLRARTAHAFIWPAACDSAPGTFAELTETVDCVGIPVSKEATECVMKKHAYVAPGRVKGGIYKGMPNDIPALIFAQPMVATADLPEDLVYEIMKLVFDPANRAEFEAIHPLTKFVTRESAMSYTNVPYHAGAVKYYKERGWWKIEDVHKKLLKELGQDK